MMNADHHFWMGKTHNVCEDYAMSGTSGGVSYAIVSDGCSSSPDTDFGARILARAALKHIYQAWSLEKYSDSVINTARSGALSLGLPQRALDATLLVAVEWEKKVHVMSWLCC